MNVFIPSLSSKGFTLQLFMCRAVRGVSRGIGPAEAQDEARLTHETHNASFCWRFTLEGVPLLCHTVAQSTMAGEFPAKLFSNLGVMRTEDFRRECWVVMLQICTFTGTYALVELLLERGCDSR